ncbi:MAG: hypothetical protein IKO68_02840 [Oscillospiraceae bacterium]|nr:hypothetical protein [Oscillospiraceae bacterium]MBR4655520.1 hypothetical protein [Oscillospiraceae bacterium]
MFCIVIITQIIKENKFSREKITEPAVVKYCDTVIKEKEIVWEKAVRRTKRAERSALESEKRFIFDGFFSVISVSAFPLNSQFCGQLFGRFRVLAYRTNNQALQKKNPQIFVLPAQESEDFGRSGGIRTHGLLDPNGSKDLRRPISGSFRPFPPDQDCSLPVLSPSIPLSNFRKIVKTVVKPVFAGCPGPQIVSAAASAAAHIVRHGNTFPAVKICDAIDKDYASQGSSLCLIQKRPCAFLDFFFD